MVNYHKLLWYHLGEPPIYFFEQRAWVTIKLTHFINDLTALVELIKSSCLKIKLGNCSPIHTQYWGGWWLKSRLDSGNTFQFCYLWNPAESAQTVLMMSFAALSEWVPQCGSSSSSKTPCSSWRVNRSRNSCLLAAAPPEKTGDLSGPCVRSVGELWPCKNASDTFAVPIIDSQLISPVMHMILNALQLDNAHDWTIRGHSSNICYMVSYFLPLLRESNLYASDYRW